MIRRSKVQSQGPYTSAELKDIWTTTQFIVAKFYSGKEITLLEQDYVIYIKKSMWHSGSWPFFTACASPFILNSIGPIARARWQLRLPLKLVTFGVFTRYGLEAIKDDILKFPLMEPLIVTAIVKHTKWIELKH